MHKFCQLEFEGEWREITKSSTIGTWESTESVGTLLTLQRSDLHGGATISLLDELGDRMRASGDPGLLEPISREEIGTTVLLRYTRGLDFDEDGLVGRSVSAVAHAIFAGEIYTITVTFATFRPTAELPRHALPYVDDPTTHVRDELSRVLSSTRASGASA
jgi:hypothetical protein